MFGNGDCFSAQQYYEEMEGAGVDGVMVARGALIKPWIFTEIQERREWDISATERLEGIRKVSRVFLLRPISHFTKSPSTYLIPPRMPASPTCCTRALGLWTPESVTFFTQRVP